ncbi:hypothetical protein EJD97_000709 [Solanum chilense]|uniref:Uncharacterized protein n=1 Tax=Solanum chilense TaxID=4083 RepID=A0A6N2AMT9_SOLCI|nr:hypothetical protein EJD97_000709 [Solanum chilense]
MQIDRNLDAGRRDATNNSQRNEGQQNKLQMQQEEWQIQAGMVSIPTKNTYIDLDEQVSSQINEEAEDHIVQIQEHRQQDHFNKNSAHQKNNRESAKEGSNTNKGTQIFQQRRGEPANKIFPSEHQQNANVTGIALNPSTPAFINVDSSAGVAVGGKTGFFQGTNILLVGRLNKGKDKVDEQGFPIREDSEASDKINLHNSKTNKQPCNLIDTGQKHNEDPFDEYGVQESEDEYDGDTHSLEEGTTIGEEISSTHYQQGPMLPNTNVEEVREVTGKQGLSPRGRKVLRQNKNTSISKPNTRARSRGV